MGIVIALIIFCLIITVHEFGHFICAKLSDIKVLEFSVGMGPKLIQRRKGETMYSLRLLPVGGYCAMEGEDGSDDDPRGFRKAKLWKRMVVLVAGAAMNFVLGIVMVTIMVCLMDSVPTTQIKGFSGVINDDGSTTYYSESYKTGLRHDDIIVKMDDISVYSVLDLNLIFGTTTKDEHDIVVKRDGKRVELTGIRFRDESTGDEIDFGLVTKDKTVLNVMDCSKDIFMSMGHIVGISLKQLITGQAKKEDISGPVGVVTAISETTQQAESLGDKVFNLVYITAMITINLGIMNLLPIPVLDGGRLLLCVVEMIRRKPVKPEHEGYVNVAGMVILFGLMIFATFNDIMRIIKG